MAQRPDENVLKTETRNSYHKRYYIVMNINSQQSTNISLSLMRDLKACRNLGFWRMIQHSTSLLRITSPRRAAINSRVPQNNKKNSAEN